MSLPEMIVIVGALTQFLKIKGLKTSTLGSILLSAGVSATVVGYYYLKISGICPPAVLFIEVLVGANVGYQVVKKRRA